MPWVVLYDGRCRFCTAQAARLARWARPGALELRDFHQPGALDAFPAITFDACMEAMHAVAPDGRVFRGAEAAVRAVATRRLPFAAAYAYYVPGIRQAADALYRRIAARRYRLAAAACNDGTCALHQRH